MTMFTDLTDLLIELSMSIGSATSDRLLLSWSPPQPLTDGDIAGAATTDVTVHDGTWDTIIARLTVNRWDDDGTVEVWWWDQVADESRWNGTSPTDLPTAVAQIMRLTA